MKKIKYEKGNISLIQLKDGAYRLSTGQGYFSRDIKLAETFEDLEKFAEWLFVEGLCFMEAVE